MRLMLLMAWAGIAFAQHAHGPASGKPVELIPGLGTHRHRIETRSDEAQKFFDQGLNLLYAFNRHEALRSFQRASELDPAAPMPHWGIAAATGPHINMDLDGDYNATESCKAVQAGLKLTKESNVYEKLYLQALAPRCPEYQAIPYQQGWRELLRRYPDDTDAATLLVESLMVPVRWKWFGRDGKPAEGTEEAIRILESILRRYPDHPGANHFYIHAVEMSSTPERAIPSAQRLMGVVPAAGHLVHMPGHIWMLLGDFEMVAATNERAVAVDQRLKGPHGVIENSYAGYHVHNLHFVAVARQMQGRFGDAMKAAEALAQGAAPFVEAMPAVADSFTPSPLFALLRFHQWDKILEMKAPSPKLLAYTALWRYARASAFAAKGKHAEALQEKKAFAAAQAAVPADWMWLNNKASDIVAVAEAALEARLANSDAVAVEHWQRAVEIQDQHNYDEPPPWFYPVRESLGGALLRAGQASEAEAVFREGLRRGPRNGRMLFGLLQSLEAQKNTVAAELVRREFEAAWKRADVQLRVEDL